MLYSGWGCSHAFHATPSLKSAIFREWRMALAPIEEDVYNRMLYKSYTRKKYFLLNEKKTWTGIKRLSSYQHQTLLSQLPKTWVDCKPMA